MTEMEFDPRERVAVAIAYERISECKESRDRFQRIVSGYEKNPNYITLELDDEVKAMIDVDAIMADMKVKKAMDLVKETAKITKPRKPAAKKKAAEAETAETVETENTEA